MNNNHVRLLYKQFSEGIDTERAVPDNELNEIINTFEDMIDWLQDHINNVKDILKGQAEKFKKKILKLKDLNGPVIPVRHH
ncbi:MAG: hypothetical protein WCW35_01925 [Bacteroidota bacterium]